MKTVDRLDHEEARQALALFSQMEAEAKGRDVDATRESGVRRDKVAVRLDR